MLSFKAAHKERFNLLGIDNQRISNVGSVKFDVEIEIY